MKKIVAEFQLSLKLQEKNVHKFLLVISQIYPVYLWSSFDLSNQANCFELKESVHYDEFEPI